MLKIVELATLPSPSSSRYMALLLTFDLFQLPIHVWAEQQVGALLSDYCVNSSFTTSFLSQSHVCLRYPESDQMYVTLLSPQWSHTTMCLMSPSLTFLSGKESQWHQWYSVWRTAGSTSTVSLSVSGSLPIGPSAVVHTSPESCGRQKFPTGNRGQT